MTAMIQTLRAAAHRRVTVPGVLGYQTGHISPYVVEPHDEGPHARVTDHRERGRIGLDALELVQVQPERVGDDRLDDVAVRADGVDGVLAEPGVPVADG